MADVQIQFSLRPWLTPNFVTAEQPIGRKQDGPKALPTIHISELSKETLDAQLERFCADVRAKAAMPRQEQP